MNTKGIIIQGSARSTGNTNKIALHIKHLTGFDFIDLKTKNIAAFDYEFNNHEDDFIPMMRELVEKYDTIIFITPVYWYTMSGIMKNFFDRISDCLHVEKEIGRKLRGMNMMAVNCSSSATELSGYFLPFERSAEYLGMNYLGDLHTWIESGKIPNGLQEKMHELFRYKNEHI